MWCRGSTRDFDSLWIGSNPIVASKFKKMTKEMYIARVNQVNLMYNTKITNKKKVEKRGRRILLLLNEILNQKKFNYEKI